MRRATAYGIVFVLLLAVPAHAAPLDPWAVTSQGIVNAVEALTIDTDTLQMAGGASLSGVLDPLSGAAVFAFDDISGTTLSVLGTRALGLLSRGNISFTGTIDVVGSGALEIGASGTLAIHELTAFESGGDIYLHADHITLSGSLFTITRSIIVTSNTYSIGLGETGGTEGGRPVIGAKPGAISLVPLPATIPLFATGLGFMAFALNRRR